jgi:hypothetical protein
MAGVPMLSGQSPRSVSDYGFSISEILARRLGSPVTETGSHVWCLEDMVGIPVMADRHSI